MPVAAPVARRLAAVLAAAAALLALVPPSPATAQPLRARLYLKNPPKTGSFGPTDPILMALQLQNVTNLELITRAGFPDADHWRSVYFTRVLARGIVVNEAEAQTHSELQVDTCRIRAGVLQVPAAIPVLRTARLPAAYFREYTFNVREHYTLPPGRYEATARIPFIRSLGPGGVISDCTDYPTLELLNLKGTPGTDIEAAVIVSNGVDFVLSKYSVPGQGFGAPIVNDAACGANPPATVCRTYRLGSTLPLKFRLTDPAGAVVATAVATVSVHQIAGSPPAQPPVDLGTGSGDSGNVFRFNPATGEYHFNLSTKQLSAGVWRVQADLDDGSSFWVHVGLR